MVRWIHPKLGFVTPDNFIPILERAYAADSPNIHKVLSALREKGFLIEMDDFGTGESSLSMIAEMPINFIKLDRSFLTSDLTNLKHLEIIRLIISLAKTLRMDIIAEGVETQEQSDLLYSLGCRYVQGYFYGKPVPATDFIKQVIPDAPDR